MKERFIVEKEDAVVITINHSDFTGNIQQWQELYFKVLSWKNTWGMAYEVDILSYYDHEAYIKIVAKAKVKDQLIDWLKSIGYNKISNVSDVVVGVCDVDTDDFDNGPYKYYVEW